MFALILDKFKTYGAVALAATCTALLAAQTLRLHAEQLKHGELKTHVAMLEREQAQAVLKKEQHNTGLTLEHARQTQENLDDFTTTQPVRDAIARADLAVAERMLRDADRRAATYRAMSEAGAAACRDLANQHETFDRHIVEGVKVVADLRSHLDRRDAEVKLLTGQLDADRALLLK